MSDQDDNDLILEETLAQELCSELGACIDDLQNGRDRDQPGNSLCELANEL